MWNICNFLQFFFRYRVHKWNSPGIHIFKLYINSMVYAYANCMQYTIMVNWSTALCVIVLKQCSSKCFCITSLYVAIKVKIKIVKIKTENLATHTHTPKDTCLKQRLYIVSTRPNSKHFVYQKPAGDKFV